MAQTTALTAGRAWSLVGVLLGLVGAVLGARRTGRRGAVAALLAGLAGAVVGGLVVAAAEGGPGTGYGIVGGYASLVVGVVAAVLGGVALARPARGRL
ncbi:hypothetical protein EKG83_17130 [Saccharothrix syringae]|uniref:GlsB/YeaQ/YmgE family stress response membrane protein n=2 Tax=Saccharothrix syringae TaxID=103733 RepID=A0A5Q0HEM8_SACSY|nr:hypothetical protein EKG83_17130 [Saccharothrix syringae]